MTFHSGTGGTATYGGVEIPTTAWDVDPAVEVVEFRNSKTGGYSMLETTYKNCPFSIELDYDFDANPFSIGGGITIGTVLSNVKLFLRGAGTNPTAQPFWSFPSAVVIGTPQRLETNGRVTTRINLRNNGAFSYPV